MSKLYDVISRLEDVAEKDVEGFENPFAEVEQVPEKVQSPALRIVLISLFFIVLGSITVAFTAWWQDWFTQQDIPSFTQSVPTQQSEQLPQTSKEMPSSPVEEHTSKPLTMVPATTTQKAETDLPIISNKQLELLPDIMGVNVGHMDNTVETLDDLIDNLAHAKEPSKDVLPITVMSNQKRDFDIGKATVENQSIVSDKTLPSSQYDEIGATKAKTSRWLHQAEVYRHRGDWQGAILLYQRVWQLSEDPGVANNLAAALIEVHRPKDAFKILQKAAIIAPDDLDIQQNLNILKQILKP